MKAKSIAHQHIVSAVLTEIEKFEGRSSLRILDVGCGSGELIAYTHSRLREIHPNLTFEIFGFDVNDHGVQKGDFISRARSRLLELLPEIDWKSRIDSILSTDPWPYPDGHFDVVISNQVLEHIEDHSSFFSELERTLNDGGVSVNLFPLVHCLYESHLNLPLAHRIGSHDLLRSFIEFLSRLGLGKFKGRATPLDVYVESHADYIWFLTNYVSRSTVIRLARRHRLRASFRYTPEFYSSKIRSMLGSAPRQTYSRNRSALLDSAGAFFLRYISSITLVLEKKQTYIASEHP